MKLAKEANDRILTPRQYYLLCKQLGIDPSASWQEMRDVFKEQRRKLHPDQAVVDHTDELFGIIEKNIKLLQAHHRAIQALPNEALKATLISTCGKEKQFEHNQGYNTFLMLHILHHTTNDQLQYVLEQLGTEIGIWAQPRVLAQLPVEVLSQSLSIGLNGTEKLTRWRHILTDYDLTRRLSTTKSALIPSLKIWSHVVFVSETNTLFEEFLSCQKWNEKLSFEKFKGVATAFSKWLTDKEALLDQLYSNHMPHHNTVNVRIDCWSPLSTSVKENLALATIFANIFIESVRNGWFTHIFDDSSDQPKRYEDRHDPTNKPALKYLLLGFAHITRFRPVALTLEDKALLASLYRKFYDRTASDASVFFFLECLRYDRSALQSPYHVFNSHATYSGYSPIAKPIARLRHVQIAYIMQTVHGDMTYTREKLPGILGALRTTYDNTSRMRDPKPNDNIYQSYYRALRLLADAGHDEFTDLERQFLQIPRWSDIRDEILATINRFLVVNNECKRLLTSTRREMIQIDRMEDLNDAEKVKLLLKAFETLIDSLGGSGALTKAKLYLGLKELAWEFYRFIERLFFMVSHPSVYPKMQFITGAPEEKLEEVRIFKIEEHHGLVQVRFQMMSEFHTPVFFQPGWDVSVYEILDGLRELAYNKEFGAGQRVLGLFGNTDRCDQAKVISKFVDSIQYLSPEQIYEQLDTAIKKQEFTSIPGFVKCVNGTKNEIREVVGLLTFYNVDTNDVITLSNKKSDTGNVKDMPKDKEAALSGSDSDTDDATDNLIDEEAPTVPTLGFGMRAIDMVD